MLVAIVADEAGKQEWLIQGMQPDVETIWLNKPTVVPGATAYIDLLFSQKVAADRAFSNRLTEWQGHNDALIIINDVIKNTESLAANFIRLNGWPGFLQRSLVEVASSKDSTKEKATAVFAAFNKTAEWVPDIPGFISARVVSMIINEAYFALEEEVSTKEAIDTAMKLGTNYPFGPFEWGQKIGLENVYNLLTNLATSNSRYSPSPLLTKEALS